MAATVLPVPEKSTTNSLKNGCPRCGTETPGSPRDPLRRVAGALHDAAPELGHALLAP